MRRAMPAFVTNNGCLPHQALGEGATPQRASASLVIHSDPQCTCLELLRKGQFSLQSVPAVCEFDTPRHISKPLPLSLHFLPILHLVM